MRIFVANLNENDKASTNRCQNRKQLISYKQLFKNEPRNVSNKI